VHREQLVVLLVGHDVIVRPQQLGPHDHGQQAADHKEHERRDQVQVTDDLVVRRRQPVGEHGAALPGRRGGDTFWLRPPLENGHTAPGPPA
jgi:hypothetical protein